jgi:hypothetical protein
LHRKEIWVVRVDGGLGDEFFCGRTICSFGVLERLVDIFPRVIDIVLRLVEPKLRVEAVLRWQLFFFLLFISRN